MHFALVLATLAASFDPAGPATTSVAAVALAPAPARTSADPCEDAAALPQDAACGKTPLCSLHDRVRTACELRDAVRSRYVFLDAKRSLLGGGFDASARLDACVGAERALAREDDPLRFYDRI